MPKRPIRIFQIAKELNISHTEILSFLKGEGIDVASHMSPVNEEAYQKIQIEFAKDKETIDRYRKEQVRREIHEHRIRHAQQITRKLNLLSIEDQRKLEAEEKRKAAERAREEERRRRVEARQRAEAEKRRKKDEELKKKEAEEKAKEKLAKEKEAKKVIKEKAKKQKLRKINLTNIEAEIGQISRRSKEKETHTKVEEAPAPSVKERVRQTLAQMETKTKKKSYKKDKDEKPAEDAELSKKILKIPEFSSVDELAKHFGTSPSDVIQKCFGLGVLATINQRLEWDMIELVTSEYDFIAEKLTDVGEELFSLEETDDDIAKAVPRAPVVTIMGHVDHGKTSLLDYIRKTNVVAGESGGITQHIGAYKVDLPDSKMITFLDTPGHEAFTAMRARGAQITDIVVLVVAADDSVMPQTVEAISHAHAANVPVVVAINKIDKPGADVEKVKRELSDNNILVEDWGGKVQSIPVSAKTGEGIDDLMNAILLEAEMLELTANRDCLGRGTVIDSRLDKGHGPMATVLIQKGTLAVGNPFICNDYPGKVRAIMNERGQRIKNAFPSDAVQILGFEKVPQAADIFAVVENERDLKRVSAERQRLRREIDQKKIDIHTLDAMSTMLKEGTIKNLPLIVKGDVDGSVEALVESLEKLNTDEVGVKVVHKGVGMVTESDVLLAKASHAVIIAFHVQVSSNAKLHTKQTGVEIRNYNIIYNAVEEIKLALEGMLEPDKVEEILGRAVVQTQFKIPKIGNIAGSKVTDGVVTRNGLARLIRDGEVILEGGEVSSLKRFKDDVKVVKDGMECGIGLEGVAKYQEGDIIEIYEIKEIKRKLETS